MKELILGAVFWTFMEYMLHRFLGHVPKKLLMRSRFFKEHSKHHHKRDYFASALDKFLTCLALGPLTFYIVTSLYGMTSAAFFTSGFLGMYFFYELLHRRLHIITPKHSYATFMRAHHSYHHFMDDKMNHGVTSPFWDIIFRTYVKPSEIRVPQRLKMKWMGESKFHQDSLGHVYRID
ncbi:MAG: sterol desaturase family protein [Bacteriovoracaceae bacterium]|nr:sterol desaturase family protein [Bacteriovoracaceae bacterium]